MAMATTCSPSGAAASVPSRGASHGARFLVLHPIGTGKVRHLLSVTTAMTAAPARCAVVGSPTAAPEAPPVEARGRISEQLAAPPGMLDELVEEALVWCSQHGLVVGDKNHPVRDVTVLYISCVQHNYSLRGCPSFNSFLFFISLFLSEKIYSFLIWYSISFIKIKVAN